MKTFAFSALLLIAISVQDAGAHACHGVKVNVIPESPKGTWLLAFATPIAGGNGSSSSWFGKYSCGLFNNCWGCRCTAMILDECDENNTKLKGYITSYNDFSKTINIKEFESKVGTFENTNGYQASFKSYINIKGKFGSKDISGEKSAKADKYFKWILAATDQKSYYVMVICDSVDIYTCKSGPLVLIFFRNHENFKCDRLVSYPHIVEALKKFNLGPDKLEYKYIPQDACQDYYADANKLKKVEWCGCGQQQE